MSWVDFPNQVCPPHWWGHQHGRHGTLWSCCRHLHCPAEWHRAHLWTGFMLLLLLNKSNNFQMDFGSSADKKTVLMYVYIICKFARLEPVHWYVIQYCSMSRWSRQQSRQQQQVLVRQESPRLASSQWWVVTLRGGHDGEVLSCQYDGWWRWVMQSWAILLYCDCKQRLYLDYFATLQRCPRKWTF